jgi:endonuclease/exonuclease/phosphatase family metal-dependent hydrolase
MQVMTFNLRFENTEDGPNAWVYRRELVTDLIRKHKPSILGSQEGMIQQLTYLQNELPEYQMNSPKRVLDDTAQYPTLFFLNRDYYILKGAEFWLSKTPLLHRSKNWDSAFPRMLSYAVVMCKEDRKKLLVAVTHLDHMGTRARYEQAKIIARWAKEYDGPVILMGDFNDHPGSAVHRLLTAPDTGLVDTWQLLGHVEDPSSFTHHRFDGIPQKTRMDWILVSTHFCVKSAQIVRDHSGDSYPSDHFPYTVVMEWK